MGKVMVCAEKPDQAKKLAAPFNHKKNGDHIAIAPCSVFPEGAIVISACGHILKSFDPADYDETLKNWTLDSLPIIPKEFKLKIDPSKKFYFNAFKKFIKEPQISLIVNAGDPAQEGQLLIDEILYFLHNKKPVKRLWTTSLTKDSVIKAFQNMKDNSHYRGYYEAGLARQRADWMLGISSSRALTILLKQKGVNKLFSAGRCQTALVNIIYQRELEIENFESRPYWDCYTEFKFGDSQLIGKWFNNESEHIFDHESAQALVSFCKESEAQVYSVKNEEKKIRPPQLYNLSALQMEANRLYGMSPANVLALAQSLYDKSFITYPRTDSKYLTPGEAKWLPTILKNLSELDEYKELVKGATRDISDDKRFVDESKVSDHYGLCLTEESVDPSSLPKGEQVIYDLIAKSVIAAHYPDHVFDSCEIIIAVQSRFTFISKGKQVKQDGWKVVYQGTESYDNTDEPDDTIMLPNLEEGECGEITSLELKEGKTSPPARFTLGNLVGIMTNAGRYVSEREDFKNSELSLGTEATRASIIQTVTARYVKVQKNLVYIQPEGRILIQALGPENYLSNVLTTGRMERYLDQILKGKGSMNEFIQGTKKVTKRVIEQLIRDSEHWNFDDFIKQIQEGEEIGPCKLCKIGKVVDKGDFYGCSNYKEDACDFKFPKKMLGKDINKQNAIKLLTTGTTALIKGFKSKNKDSFFDAYVVWDSNTKTIKFSFPQSFKGEG